MADRSVQINRIKELTSLLSKASRAYYRDASEIMSDREYDKLYDELDRLEKETGVRLTGSPTARVGDETLSELPKERHEKPMLSLDKTKNPEDVKAFLGDQRALISWKLDGLTIVLTYESGALVKAVTRGNGEIGEVITPNARKFQNIPLTIDYKGELILRGEAVIGYKDFNRINEEIAEADARYKNPRNLCSGSVRQLNSAITAERSVRFYAFALVRAAGVDFHNSRSEQFDFLAEQGFDVVEHYFVTAETVDERIHFFENAISDHDIPSDGLVFTYEDIAYGESLGSTAKYPRNSYAFKWTDEIAKTTLREIEWSPSRTGLINPVAIFDPVELEGTTVSRASVHNVSIMKSLELGIGDTIEVYKANMIIPQIAENLTRSAGAPIPATCPACGGRTRIQTLGDVETLYCENPDCPVKKIKAFALFTSRDALNIAGLSEATLEKLLARGFVREYRDLFHLEDHREEITEMEGFGEKSFENLRNSAEKARETTLARLLYGLGIANIGVATAKLIAAAFNDNIDKARNAGEEELAEISGVGGVIAEGYVRYFQDPAKNRALDNLLAELTLRQETNTLEQIFDGETFVITGSVSHFANRGALKAVIEQRGGKVASSVSSKTKYLINNDNTSGSKKNREARELGIPVITEEEFLTMMEEGK